MELSPARRSILQYVLYSLLAAMICFPGFWKCQAQERANMASALPIIVVGSARSTDSLRTKWHGPSDSPLEFR
jgi:hypothetical protein